MKISFRVERSVFRGNEEESAFKELLVSLSIPLTVNSFVKTPNSLVIQVETLSDGTALTKILNDLGYPVAVISAEGGTGKDQPIPHAIPPAIKVSTVEAAPLKPEDARKVTTPPDQSVAPLDRDAIAVIPAVASPPTKIDSPKPHEQVSTRPDMARASPSVPKLPTIPERPQPRFPASGGVVGANARSPVGIADESLPPTRPPIISTPVPNSSGGASVRPIPPPLRHAVSPALPTTGRDISGRDPLIPSQVAPVDAGEQDLVTAEVEERGDYFAAAKRRNRTALIALVSTVVLLAPAFTFRHEIKATFAGWIGTSGSSEETSQSVDSARDAGISSSLPSAGDLNPMGAPGSSRQTAEPSAQGADKSVTGRAVQQSTSADKTQRDAISLEPARPGSATVSANLRRKDAQNSPISPSDSNGRESIPNASDVSTLTRETREAAASDSAESAQVATAIRVDAIRKGPDDIYSSCMRPLSRPSIPNGRTASREQMVSATRLVKEFDRLSTQFQNCVKEQEPSLGSRNLTRSAQVAEQKVNESFEEVSNLAGELNAQIRIFRVRSDVR